MATSSQFEPVAQSRLDIFNSQKAQITQVGHTKIVLQPHNSIDQRSKRILFRSIGKGTDFYRFFRILSFDADWSLTKPDGTVVEEATEPGVINYINQTCIDSLDIKLNSTYVTRNTQNYAYRAYIEALMSGNMLEAQGRLACSGFYQDSTNSDTADKTVNLGFAKRMGLFKGGKTVCTIGKLHTDLAGCELYFPDNIDVEIEINLASDDFMLLSKAANDAVMNLKSAQLTLEVCHLNPAVLTAHARVFQNRNAVIPFQHVEVRTETVPAGLRNVQINNIVTGAMPSIFLTCMVPANAYAGDKLKNPLAFKHYDLMSMFVHGPNGKDIPLGPFDFKATPTQHAAGYQSLLSSTGLLRSGEPCLITYDNFPTGHAIFGVDLSADGESAAHHTHSSVQQVGSLGLNANFATPLAEAVTFIFYCLWEGSSIEIDKYRNVFVSF